MTTKFKALKKALKVQGQKVVRGVAKTAKDAASAATRGVAVRKVAKSAVAWVKRGFTRINAENCVKVGGSSLSLSLVSIRCPLF